MDVKLKAEYGAVLHMPVLKEGKDRVSHLPGSMQGHQSYTQPGEEQMKTAPYLQYNHIRLIKKLLRVTVSYQV